MDGSVRIVALKNNEPIGAWEFEKESVSIGRSKTADVRLDDAAISRVHCLVEVRPSGVYVKDCGSRNGIWIAGRRVQEAMLSSRDEVVIEHYRIKAYMVWGNTVANRFSDRVEEKTHVRGRTDLGRDTRRPTIPSGARRQAPVAAPARAVPIAGAASSAAEPPPAVVKPAARPAAKPAVGEGTERLPAAPALEATDALPEPKRRTGRGTLSAEVEDILADIRPAQRAAAPAPPAGRSERKVVTPGAPAERAERSAPVASEVRKAHAARDVAKSAPSFRFDEDEEDDEETLPPAFSMIDALANSRTRRPADGRGVVEVIRYRGMNVLDVARVDRGGAYALPFGGATLVDFSGEEARVDPCGMSGELRRASGSKAIRGAASLRYGDVADLMGDDGIGYLVRFTEPMAPSRTSPLLAAAAATAIVGSTGASVGLHMMFCFTMILVDMLKPEEPEWSDFARIEMPEPAEQIAVAPTPAPTPESRPEPTPPPPPQKLAKAPERLSRKPVNNQPAGGADRTEAKVASAGVLGGLGKMDLKIDSKSPALAAVTNLDAIKSTGGKSGGFRVSALTGKVPGDVQMGRAGRANGTVEISTLNTKDLGGLARGGFGGTAKKGGGKVKGVVSDVPLQNVGVQGSLDRAQIAAVVNKHINEIRHCYEKNLINDPGLAGKVQVEWTINPDGTVGAVKTKFSSMKGGDVTGCIGSRIRTWQFPRPKGNGYVIVNYPFMFDSVGF